MITLKFKTLTPLHISNGEELAYKLDYIIKWNLFCRFNSVYLAKRIVQKNKINFSQKYSLSTLINSVLTEDIYDDMLKENFLYCVNINRNYFNSLQNEDAEGLHFVKEFINSNGKFYIPASSIKGALLTILGRSELGISPKSPYIDERVVINDSEFINREKFCVYLTNERPPSINIMCMKPDSEFDINILQKGNLNTEILKKSLVEYSKTQISKANRELENFSTVAITEIESGADIYLDALKTLSSVKLEENEYLINLGYGGGSWFKIEKGKIPYFESKNPLKQGQKEPAHTTFTFTMQNNIHHIGWCKLKIIEN